MARRDSDGTLELWLRAHGEFPKPGAVEVWGSRGFSCLRVLHERLSAAREERTSLQRKLNRLIAEFEA